MLKCLFMDVSPYFIDSEVLFKKSWETFLNSQSDKKYTIDFLDEIKELIDESPDFIDCQNLWLEKISKDNYDLLKEKFESVFNFHLKQYFDTSSISKSLLTFLDDVHNDEQVCLILVTANKWLENFIKDCKLDLDLEVKVIDSSYYLTAKFLIDFASDRNIMWNEIASITQVKETINDLIKNNIFCVTINPKCNITNKFLLVLKSIDELVYSNLTYNFCSLKSSDDDNDL